MKCPRCKAEHVTIDDNGKLVSYESSVCVICAYPMYIHRQRGKRPRSLFELIIQTMNIQFFKNKEVDTTVTDEDMIKLHIDIALKNNDREEFNRLTNQLKELNENVKTS